MGCLLWVLWEKLKSLKKTKKVDTRKILRLDSSDSNYCVTSFFPLPFREERCCSLVMNLLYTESRLNLQERETMNRPVGRIER